MSQIPPISNNPTKTSTDFELFFRISLDAMIITDMDGKIIDFNQAYEKITGYNREELFQINGGWDLILEEDIPELAAKVEEIKTGMDVMTNYEVRLINKKGELRVVSYDAKADMIKQQIYAIGRDITQLKEQERNIQLNESRLRFFFDHALDGMCIIVDRKYQLVNKAFLDIIGEKDEKNVIGRDFIDFVEDGFKEKVNEYVNNNSEDLYTSKIIRTDGTIRNIEVTGKSIIFNNQKMRISVIRDLDERKKMQEIVQENEDRFRAIFQNSTMGIVLTEFDGTILEINQTLAERLGYETDELRGESLLSIISDEDKSGALSGAQLLISGVIETSFGERRLIKKSLEQTWSKMTCSVITTSEGRKLVLAILENIDSQKSNERALIQSEEKFRAVYESSPMGILISKSPGFIYDINPAFAEMMGYSEEELIGKSLLEITHPADTEASAKWLEQIYSGKIDSYVAEKKYIKKDGTAFWAKAVVSVMSQYNDEVITVAIIENIEKKKNTEDALEQKNKELTQINQELEHFAYVASHDLQEPLRTITSFIQILERRYTNKLDEDAIQFMGFVVDGAKRMQTLIHDLLEYSRINRFNTGYEKIDLNEIFNTVSRVLKDKIESNDALVIAENLPYVYGNRIQLTQVFQNLIDNAIKFKAKKRKPEIIISVNDLKDKWELTFKDNGIGISQEYFQRIFVIFQRLHTLEEYTGTGIGLAICKKIIERHGGEIWVDSSPGKGTEFHLTISKHLMRALGN
jgi:PAS domain S-box-containing protein